MQAVKLIALGIVVLVLAACPRPDEPAPPPPAVEEPVMETVVTPTPVTAEFEDLAGTGVTGMVIASPREDRTIIELSVIGAPPNESIGGRVQSGTCESPGPELARLDAISTDAQGQGRSETNVGHASHLILDGNHIAAVYAPGAEPERDLPMACATLPTATP